MYSLASGGEQHADDVRENDVADRLQPGEAERCRGVEFGRPDGAEAGALDFGQVGAGVERDADNDGLERGQDDASVGQGEVEEEDLHQQRRVEEEDDIGADGPAQRAAAVMQHGGAGEADGPTGGEGDCGDLQRKRCAAGQDAQVRRDLAVMQRVVHLLPPPRSMAAQKYGVTGTLVSIGRRNHFSQVCSTAPELCRS